MTNTERFHKEAVEMSYQEIRIVLDIVRSAINGAAGEEVAECLGSSKTQKHTP